MTVIRLGTRGSQLALAQTRHVAQRLQKALPGCSCEIVVIRTKGDAVQDKALHEIGGKGIFVQEIEEQILSGQVDVGVHSMKDMPAAPAEGLAFSRTWPREDPRDVLVLRRAASLAELPAGTVLATGSKRRAFQLNRLRPDLQVTGIRGNVDTRLRKMEEGAADGLVMAAAGLRRLGLAGRITQYLDPESELVPACGQGALALEYRADRAELAALLDSLSSPEDHRLACAERAFLAAVEGGCHIPVGAYCRREGDGLLLTALLGTEDGARLERAVLRGGTEEGEALARRAAALLREKLGKEGRL